MLAIFIAFGLFAVATILFVIFIVKRDRGLREPTSALSATVLFGIVAVVVAGILNETLLPPAITDVIDTEAVSQVSLLSLLFYGLGVGIIEESVKCIPLAFFLYKKRYFNEMTDGIIYFGLVGLTFGILEDISYTLMHGGGTGIVRIIISPYLHSAFSILFGMCLIQKKLLRKSWLLPVAGLGAAIVAHGVYDFFAFLGGAWILAALILSVVLNVMLFVIFRRAQKADQTAGLSVADGDNKFCRNCGYPNPQRMPHCTRCGSLT